MPYSKTSDLPKQLMTLPLTAKKVFLKAFNTASKKHSEDRAFKIAWSAVKKVYTKKGNKWVRRSSVKVKSVVSRNGWFGRRYYFDTAIASNITAEDGLIATDSLLENISKTGKIDFNGDLEHAKLEGNEAYNGLFKLIKHVYSDGKLFGRFQVDRTHPKYKWFINKYANKKIGVSAEFYNPTQQGNKIIDCDRLGWTITDDPVDPNTIAM